MTKRALLFSLYALLALSAVAQHLPIDSAIHLGTLPNGMTYYIRHCSEPAGRAECYLVHKVGSIMEEDNQRGIAHFLEHMAFNGTEHFPEVSMVDYLTSSGMSYGGDINASTGFDQTVYHISNISVNRPALIDSVLLAMSDLSGSLTLDNDAIAKEKGIIEEEWRSQSSATVRIYEKALPMLLGDTRYAHRIPIGDINIVRNITRNQLMDFYSKWFRPDLQAIIIVGDFEANDMKQRVTEIFSRIPARNDSAPTVVDNTVINRQAFASCADSEVASTMVNVYFPFEDLPFEERNTITCLRRNLYAHIIADILNERINNDALKSDAPLQYASCVSGDFLVNSTLKAITITGVPKTDMAMQTLNLMLTEAQRIVEHGFTQSELERAQKSMNIGLDNAVARIDKHTSTEYVVEYIDHFMNGGYIPGIVWECNKTKEELANLSRYELNAFARQIIDFNKLRVLVIGADETTIPNEKEISDCATCIATSNTEAPAEVENSTEALIQHMPVAGHIVTETTDSTTSATVMTLSNGATVQLKPTTFQNNEVLLNATSNGGCWMYDENSATELRLIDHVVENSALGQWTQAKLQQRLSTTPLSLVYQISDTYDDINGACHTTDLETLLQLNYLYFTDVQSDAEAYQILRNRLVSQVEQMASNPSFAFNDSIASTLYSHNTFYRPLTAQLIQNADFTKALDIYHQRVANAGDFTFSIVGDFDINAIRPLIERYIASLPANGIIDQPEDRSTYATGDHDVVWLRPMLSPKGCIYACLMGNIDYSLRNALLTDITGQVMQVALTSHLREELRGTYGVEASSALARVGGKWIINTSFETEPARTQEMVGALAQVFDLMMSYGTTEHLLDVIKGQMLKDHETAVTTNAYWLNVLRDKAQGYDTHTGYADIISSLTIDQLNDFITSLNPTTRIRIIMQGHSQ